MSSGKLTVVITTADSMLQQQTIASSLLLQTDACTLPQLRMKPRSDIVANWFYVWKYIVEDTSIEPGLRGSSLSFMSLLSAPLTMCPRAHYIISLSPTPSYRVQSVLPTTSVHDQPVLV
jgi:hypothetical protein